MTMPNVVLKGEGVALPGSVVKRRPRFSSFLIAACLVAACVGYLFADRVGQNRLATARIVSAVTMLDALKNLKAGELADATRSLERLCFADSAAVLGQTGWRVEAFGQTGVSALITYRANYRTNEVEWTPTERKLEKLLAEKK